MSTILTESDELFLLDYFKDIQTLNEEMKKYEMNNLEKILSTHKLRPVNKSTAGFSKIASQIHKVSISKGFQLNLLLVGCNGLGKSTFVNNLFHTQFEESKRDGSIIESTPYTLVENGVNLEIKLINVPDFGEKINNSQSWKTIENYLDRCFAKQFHQEQQICRSSVHDTKDNLVHLCLYFVQPSCQEKCLKALDIEFLKGVHHKVNIVPLIAKADSMTHTEILLHKANLSRELELHEIDYFRFTVPDDSGWKSDNQNLKYPDKKSIQSYIDKFPFAIAAGNETITLDNKQVTVRSYPWGYIDIDNLEHCDTAAVRTLLLATHLQEFISRTHCTMYENYRSSTLTDLCSRLSISPDNQSHPALYLENYFKKVNVALDNKVNEMENGFQELSGRKQEALNKKRKDIENESLKMSQELNYLYRKFEKDFAYFVNGKTQWDCDNIDYHETCGTLKISKHGRVKPISKR